LKKTSVDALADNDESNGRSVLCCSTKSRSPYASFTASFLLSNNKVRGKKLSLPTNDQFYLQRGDFCIFQAWNIASSYTITVNNDGCRQSLIVYNKISSVEFKSINERPL
jgi:hypothetical protein